MMIGLGGVAAASATREQELSGSDQPTFTATRVVPGRAVRHARRRRREVCTLAVGTGRPHRELVLARPARRKSYRHCTQVSAEIASASSAVVPRRRRRPAPRPPRCRCADARRRPATGSASPTPPRATSMRDSILTGPLRAPAAVGPVGARPVEPGDLELDHPFGRRDVAVEAGHHHPHREAVLLGSGSPFMPIAKIALRSSSCSTDSGVPAVKPSMLCESTMSAPDGRLRARRACGGSGSRATARCRSGCRRPRSRRTSGSCSSPPAAARCSSAQVSSTSLLDHAGDLQRPRRRVDARDLQRGVDAIELARSA